MGQICPIGPFWDRYAQQLFQDYILTAVTGGGSIRKENNKTQHLEDSRTSWKAAAVSNVPVSAVAVCRNNSGRRWRNPARNSGLLVEKNETDISITTMEDSG
eukprot:8289545-Ditylum_brightwellii.AAC.1